MKNIEVNYSSIYGGDMCMSSYKSYNEERN